MMNCRKNSAQSPTYNINTQYFLKFAVLFLILQKNFELEILCEVQGDVN